MVKVIAIKDFHGSVVNRDDLGVVKKGDVIEVSGNDAAYLEREGYAERVAELPVVEETPAAPSEPASAGESKEPAAKQSKKS